MTHICIDKVTIIGSDNGYSPRQYQAVIWHSAGIVLIRTLGTNFSEMLSKIHLFLIEENAFENVFYEMMAILPWFQCVKASVDSKPALVQYFLKFDTPV